jgi:diaminopimelate epimerase
MRFAKLHGLGNDFLVAEAGETGEASLSALALRICERHQGIGADGMLIYAVAGVDSGAHFSVRVFNADGSEAEMSGNGVRCLAAYLHHTGMHRHPEVRFATAAGLKSLRLVQFTENCYSYRGSMGAPILDPGRIPCTLRLGADPIVDFALQIGTDSVSVTATSMGNPHCTTFWSDVSKAPIDRLGPLLERHPSFPNRTNVEFVQVRDLRTLSVRFWERGVGPTHASGTGSSAAAVAAILRGSVQSPVTVQTALGEMGVEWIPGEDLWLTGPSELICTGEYVPSNEGPHSP